MLSYTDLSYLYNDTKIIKISITFLNDVRLLDQSYHKDPKMRIPKIELLEWMYT